MQRLRGPLTALMCLSLLAPSEAGLAQAAPLTRPPSKEAGPHPLSHPGQLQGDERILHALNRFTFGPRPGDLRAVQAMGLDRWFEQQLHPGDLNQPDLNSRLAQFPRQLRIRS